MHQRGHGRVFWGTLDWLDLSKDPLHWSHQPLPYLVHSSRSSGAEQSATQINCSSRGNSGNSCCFRMTGYGAKCATLTSGRAGWRLVRDYSTEKVARLAVLVNKVQQGRKRTFCRWCVFLLYSCNFTDFRLRKKSKTKKYGVISSRDADLEMRPLEEDDDDEDVTVFEVNGVDDFRSTDRR